MKKKVLIFIPYQDSDNFLSDGILTREFAMLYLMWKLGYKTVINVKKPRTFLDQKRYTINDDYFPNGTIEQRVKQILEMSETIQHLPIINFNQIMKRRGWWNEGYQKKIKDLNIEDNMDYFVYSNNPFASILIQHLYKKGCKVYFDVMDNFAIHPSLSFRERSFALKGYKDIFKSATIISANSQQTCSYMKAYTEKDILLVKNGVFKDNESVNVSSISEVQRIRVAKMRYKKCVGYIGKLGLRLDADLIKSICKECSDILFVFVGGYLKGQINSKLLELFENNDNILHIDSVPSAYVNPIMNEFDILTIPHSVGKNENGGDPLKLYQYFTTNKPIITTPILGVDEYKDYIKITELKEEWISFIKETPSNKKVSVLRDFTWESRLSQIKEVIIGE